MDDVQPRLARWLFWFQNPGRCLGPLTDTNLSEMTEQRVRRGDGDGGVKWRIHLSLQSSLTLSCWLLFHCCWLRDTIWDPTEQNRTIQNPRENHVVEARDLTDRTSKSTLFIMFVHIRDVYMNTKRFNMNIRNVFEFFYHLRFSPLKYLVWPK